MRELNGKARVKFIKHLLKDVLLNITGSLAGRIPAAGSASGKALGLRQQPGILIFRPSLVDGNEVRVYSIEYVLAGDPKTHRINISAPSAKAALDQLAERFGSELKEFHIQPMDESGGDKEDSK